MGGARQKNNQLSFDGYVSCERYIMNNGFAELFYTAPQQIQSHSGSSNKQLLKFQIKSLPEL